MNNNRIIHHQILGILPEGKWWSESLRLDTLSLNTPGIPESLSLPITSRIPLGADSPKMNAIFFYYTHLL